MNRGSALLRAWMKANGKKQKDLAEALNIHQTTVSSWLLGRVGEISVAVGFEKVAGVPASAWLEEASDEERATAEATGEHAALHPTGT